MKKNKFKATPKKITNEILARMIAKGFEETAKKADVDERFDKVDQRLDKVEYRLDKVDHRLNAVTSDIGLIRADIHDLKTTQEADIKSLYPRVERLEKRIPVRQ